ncbi:MAG: hypothetical protein HY544_03850 [Candidatus Diapherotrites archaeon]|uniref:Uncharacterized protein n=1 Tax=Candidatus Iainarchaeum sp. TaxID=3101447 RepID=A0A8T3YPD6_9ARCH|nr:hypothetical protein [Candidatus Diapherotrites archaeon]
MPPKMPMHRRPGLRARVAWGMMSLARPRGFAGRTAMPQRQALHMARGRGLAGTILGSLFGMGRSRAEMPSRIPEHGLREVNLAGNPESEIAMNMRAHAQMLEDAKARAANEMKDLMNSRGFLKRNPNLPREAAMTIFELRYLFFTALQKGDVKNLKEFRSHLAKWIGKARRNPQNPEVAAFRNLLNAAQREVPAERMAGALGMSLERSFDQRETKELNERIIPNVLKAKEGENPGDEMATTE